MLSEVFRSARTCSDLFRPVRTCLDTFGHVRTRSDTFRHVQNVLENFGLFGIIADIFGAFSNIQRGTRKTCPVTTTLTGNVLHRYRNNLKNAWIYWKRLSVFLTSFLKNLGNLGSPKTTYSKIAEALEYMPSNLNIDLCI